MKAELAGCGGLVVAFSGGVDSTLLLDVAHELLGERVLAVTARSASFPARELEAAEAFCQERGIRWQAVDSEELDIEGFSHNPPNRCYLCKSALFGKLQAVAAENGIWHIAEGSNADDEGDYRPGLQAIAELGILSPLRTAGLTKAEIRELSRQRGLPTADKPSFACLASRLPYGTEITPQLLARIDAAEQQLLDMGLAQVRVRVHEDGRLARIEADAAGLDALCSSAALRRQADSALKNLGFTYVSLDLEGYRTGSMNATL